MKEILKTLAGRISRKAILLTVGMILVYMVVVTPNAVHAIITIGVISGLAIIGTILQFYLDKKSLDQKNKN